MMKLISFLLFAVCLHVAASSSSQTITLTVKDQSIRKVFAAIEQQTGYVVFSNREMLAHTRPVSISVSRMPLVDFLTRLLKDQPLSFLIEEKTIILSSKAPAPPLPETKPGVALLPASRPPGQPVSGRVVDMDGKPIAGVSVRIRENRTGAFTGPDGKFTIPDIPENATIEITAIGFSPLIISVVKGQVAGAYDKQFSSQLISRSMNSLLIRMSLATSSLNEVVINKGYYTEKKRLSTGNVSTVSAETIQKQPVGNPLSALQGQVAGMVVTPTNGVPGSAIKVEIRGTNSLANGTDPLFVIDGVPFAPGNSIINQTYLPASYTTPMTIYEVTPRGVYGSTTTGRSGISPFNSLNPADIESIEILKDADATVIYGSRGANGVVLITTKRGKPGKTVLNVNVNSGESRVTRMMPMMKTPEYLAMRREAFKNDGKTPTIKTAPDLLAWDTTRYTDWQKLLIGGTAHATDVSASVSGGNTNTQFLIGTGYRYESMVIPGNNADRRASLNLALTHASSDKRFSLNLSLNYTSDVNNQSGGLNGGLELPPNAPNPYDSAGKLNWQEGGASFDNPMAFTLMTNEIKTDNLLANLVLAYKITKGLSIKSSFGYNTVQTDEKKFMPLAAGNPANSSSYTALAQFASNKWKGLIVEPGIEYSARISQGKLSAYAGSTWHSDNNSTFNATGTGYNSDMQLGTLTGASNISTDNNFSYYRYAALFGRIGYVWREKYSLNFTGRRDGSSRFGPGKQFNNFGAIGAAWIFSEESLIKTKLPVLSFGKLRGSLGVTGNDQIGDYKFLDTWTSLDPSITYGGHATIGPDGLYNPDFRWERCRKMEISLELGWWNNRISFEVTHYSNRSSNQLIGYKLPSQAGFSTVLRNFPATIQNAGWEFEGNADLIRNKDLRWNLGFNLTIPRNRLLAFPGILTSSYAYLYDVGQSVNIIKGYRATGVDKTTGVYTFEDVDKDGVVSNLFSSPDYQFLGNRDPKFYGGIKNQISYRGFELTVFAEFKKQLFYNYLFTVYGTTRGPGSMVNQPVYLSDRWQHPGDITDISRFTATTASAAYKAGNNFGNYSNGVYTDAAYLRLKNIELYYQLPADWLPYIKRSSFRVYLQAQNLFIITKLKGIDPETPNYTGTIPPLKTVAAGIQLNF